MATVRFQLRRDTAENWISVNPILGPGEPALETDTLLVKYGDGATEWIDLGYSALDLPAVLAAYADGEVPSDFTLSIVDAADDAAWRTAIGAQAANANLSNLADVTAIEDGEHIVVGFKITTARGLITAITAA